MSPLKVLSQRSSAWRTESWVDLFVKPVWCVVLLTYCPHTQEAETRESEAQSPLDSLVRLSLSYLRKVCLKKPVHSGLEFSGKEHLLLFQRNKFKRSNPGRASCTVSRLPSTEPHPSPCVRISCKDLKCQLQLVSPASPLRHSCLSDSFSGSCPITSG